MRFAEIFGHGIDDHSELAWRTREAKHCPFKNGPCTKSSKTDPIGICSLSDGQYAASLCPTRFVERDKIFLDAAKLAFGSGVEFGLFPEVRILKIPSGEIGIKDKKIGKVDYILGRVENGEVVDFAAVEVQAVYFSGGETRSPLRQYMLDRKVDENNSERRPDFRSSAQKRLVPQLQLKVPVFRRWGKKFFVVVDSQFFGALPKFNSTTAANSEVTWLTYPIELNLLNYSLGEVQVVHSEWDEVRNALREGAPPDPDEIVDELNDKLKRKRSPARILRI